MTLNYFEDCKAAVKSMLYPDLQPGKILPEGKLEQFVDMTLLARDEWRNNVNRDALIRELKSEIDIGFSENYIQAPDPDRDHIEWLWKEKKKINWKLWNRYKIYLQRNHPISVTNKFDSITDDILGALENPNRLGKWNTRGLVVGRVQSGKTSNYIGLVNKAFDAGYKRIIVLAGLEKDLRVQTQVRFEEGCLGKTSGKLEPNKRTGVGLYSNLDDLKDIKCFTTRDSNGDIKRNDIEKWGGNLKSDEKLLLVVKKNVSVLESLILWLAKNKDSEDADAEPYKFRSAAFLNNFPEYKNGLPKPVISSSPLLIIDDEADHASIDTKKQIYKKIFTDSDDVDDLDNEIPDPDHDPSRTNECIRKILNIFDRNSYVGYTATPFANIFINPEGETPEEGQDLFPKDFVYSLPTPSNYVGIEEVFNEDEPDEALKIKCQFNDLIKIIEDHVENKEDLTNPRAEKGWMPPLQKNTGFKPRYRNEEVIPPSLENAILSFLISSAVRKIRGQSNQHNTMMIHVTRFKDVQDEVSEQVEFFITKIKSAEIGSSEIIDRFKSIWETDYLKTINNELNPNNKEIDFKLLLKNIFGEKGIIEKIEYVRLRGGVKETLDYNTYKNTGKTVIVVGGQKLSRGLTLEGLSVSYFLRTAQSILADTMTQMGRWFGYRIGYLDLCRMYITNPLKVRFHEFAGSLRHLDAQFKDAIQGGFTPRDYMYIVNEDPDWKITSRQKSYHTVLQKLQYSGMLSQSINLWSNDKKIKANNLAVEKLLESLNDQPSKSFDFNDSRINEIKPKQKRFLWKNIDSKKIIDFFNNFQTTPYALHNNSHGIKEYIKLINENKSQLLNWSVVLANGSHESIKFNDEKINIFSPKCIFRSNQKFVKKDSIIYKNYKDVVPLGVLIEPSDELVDLNQEEWEMTKLIHDQNNIEKISENKKVSKKIYSGIAAREVRGIKTNQYRGLLILYPIITDLKKEGDKGLKTFSFCISFPKTNFKGKWVRVPKNWFKNKSDIYV